MTDSGRVSGATSGVKTNGHGPLGTPGQIAAEKRALRLIQAPEVAALRPALRAMLEADPAARLPDAAQLIDRAIDLWSMDLVVCEAIAGAGVAGDNPDHIPRTSFIEGSCRYEVRGRLSSNPPAQLSFEIIPGTPGATPLRPQSNKSPDLGAQVSLLKDSQMTFDADGRFTILIGPENEPGNANFMKTDPGPMTIIVRDTLSAWSQIPATLDIRLLGEPSSPPPTEDDILKRFVADLPGYMRFWSSFKDNWLGGLSDNILVGPVAREGGWGYLGAGRFNLGRDDALVISTTDGGGKYTGFQITDPWMLIPRDSRNGNLSLNNSQVARNPDGSVTYALSPSDPGLANWIDTGGLQHGFLLLRWAGMPAQVDAQALVRQVEVMKLSDIPTRIPAAVPRLDAKARAVQVAKRTTDYDRRLGASSSG